MNCARARRSRRRGSIELLCCLTIGVAARYKRPKRLKDLETENARLRKAISDLTLDKQILQEAARGNY
jgi:cell division protein FtsB